MTSKPVPSEIDYIFVEGAPFSLALGDSDFTQNQVILDPLVGTLVKYGPTGTPEPYLAQSWETSQDGLTYSFKLRPGLACTDGHPLTPSNFVSSFVSRLSAYSKKTQALEFEKLKGWREFASTGDSRNLGVIADEVAHSVKFKFDRKPDDLFNFLRMPYFGFYSPANFAAADNGRFSIISCGAFALVEANESQIIVQRRTDWNIHGTGGIQLVRFLHTDSIPERPARPTIVDSKLTDAEAPMGFFKVQGTPIMLVSMILSPSLPFFRDKPVRQWFASKVRQASSSFTRGVDSALSVSTFFQDSNDQTIPDLPIPRLSVKKITASVSARLPSPFQNSLKSFLSDVFREADVALEFVTVDLARPDQRDKFFGNELVDIRVNGVAVNPYFYPSVFRMMFCSRLGISFPDPSKRICALVDEFENDPFAKEMDFREKVNQIVADDSAVIPLARTRLQWLYSDHFDKSSVMPIPNYPRFELLKINSQ